MPLSVWAAGAAVEMGISVVIGGVYNSGIPADPRNNAKHNYQDADPHLVQRALEPVAI